MSRKPDTKRSKKAEISLTPEESREMQMILDRLSVQDPDGESLESYLQSLRQALVDRESVTAALIDRLSRTPSKVGFQTFLMLKGVVKDRSHQRIVKQAGYRFSQRGYSAPSEASQPERVILIQKEVKKPLAHMAPVPGTLWLVSAIVPESDTPAPVVVSTFVDGETQRVRIKVTESSHRGYREYIQKITDHVPDAKPCEIPIGHAARLFFDMLGLFSRTAGSSADADHAKHLLEPFYNPQDPPYVFKLMPAIEVPEQRLRDVDADTLLKGMDIGWLILSKDDLAPYWQKIQDLENPVLVVPREVQEERSMDVVRRAGDELCTGKTRTLYTRFFEEQALWLKLSGKADQAMEAWIVAQHLRTEANAGENPVVLKMVALSMQAHWSEEFEAKDREAKSAEPFQRTESGLILPA